jgi:hypothetical protein
VTLWWNEGRQHAVLCKCCPIEVCEESSIKYIVCIRSPNFRTPKIISKKRKNMMKTNQEKNEKVKGIGEVKTDIELLRRIGECVVTRRE